MYLFYIYVNKQCVVKVNQASYAHAFKKTQMIFTKKVDRLRKLIATEVDGQKKSIYKESQLMNKVDRQRNS